MNTEIVINDQRKLQAVQQEFNHLFPYLKIEFFRKPHRTSEASPRQWMLKGDATIGECRTVHHDGTLSITPGMTVSALEQCFRDQFGLSVQVFRKSSKVWLETTVTDGWTLEQQNREGLALSQPFGE